MEFKPHDYQKYATEFIESHPIAAVILQMGLGKTVCTLTAIEHLIYDTFEVSKVLIVAPLRVAKVTWSDEIDKWDHLSHLTYSVAVGSEKERLSALKKKADLYMINRENLQWLIEKSGLPFDYDMVVLDELSSFKSWQSKRFRAFMKVRPKVQRVVGLTGTPSSNGLMDLFAEFKCLDMGERLGRFITQYRNYCIASRPTIESSTKEDEIEVKTETLSITASPLSGGYVKARTSDTTTEEAYEGWYQAVYLPTDALGGSEVITEGGNA